MMSIRYRIDGSGEDVTGVLETSAVLAMSRPSAA
jgi:hypothetical protein